MASPAWIRLVACKYMENLGEKEKLDNDARTMMSFTTSLDGLYSACVLTLGNVFRMGWFVRRTSWEIHINTSFFTSAQLHETHTGVDGMDFLGVFNTMFDFEIRFIVVPGMLIRRPQPRLCY
jgi:hypothetical protein